MIKQPSNFVTLPLGVLAILLILVVGFLSINTLVYAYTEAVLPTAESPPTSATEALTFVVE